MNLKVLWIENITKLIDYKFSNNDFLIEAFTHPSLSINPTNSKSYLSKQGNYERLEFLGDAVLGLVITEFLISEYQDEREGELAKRRAALVCGETLAKIANDIGLGTFIIMTEGEKNCGGRKNKTNLENVLEALIGAIYSDGGLEVVRKFIYKYWPPIARLTKIPPKDPKTSLQEWAQKLGKPIPAYNIISTKGPAHLPVFTVEVMVEGIGKVSASASSRRSAERSAAELLLSQLVKDDENTELKE